MAATHSYLEHHDARVPFLQSPILREAYFALIAAKKLGSLLRCRSFLLAQFASRFQFAIAFFTH